MAVEAQFSKAIRTLLIEKGIRMADMARAIDVPLESVSRVIWGRRVCIKIRLKIEDFLMTPFWSSQFDFENGWYNRFVFGLDIRHASKRAIRVRAKQLGCRPVSRRSREQLVMAMCARINHLETERESIPGGGGWKFANEQFSTMFPKTAAHEKKWKDAISPDFAQLMEQAASNQL